MGSIPTRSRHPLRSVPPGPGAGAARPAPGRSAGRWLLLGLLLAGVWLGRAPEIAAQDTVPPATDPPAGQEAVSADSARTGPPVTPLGAFARSLVVPGWGQAVVDKPERGAVYFVAEAATLFMALRAQLRLNAARRGLPADSGLVAARKEQRENWFALAVFWSLLSGVDAWVSTHFWEFEGKLRPPEDGSAGVELRYEIPLGGG